MKDFMKRRCFVLSIPAYIALFTLLIVIASCRKDDVKKLKNFEQVNLVANNGNYGAPNIDPLQINAWGLAWAPSGIAWVNSQGGHVSALYNGEGVATEDTGKYSGARRDLPPVTQPGLYLMAVQILCLAITLRPDSCLLTWMAFYPVGMARQGMMRS